MRREHGLGSVSSLLHSLGDLYLDQGDLPSAERSFRTAVLIAP